ncbi:MAG: SH3 domain-containing protein [Ruminococcus sp.]|nr:SH3 domain-containing protein [Ruminococcus sp.]
MSRKDSEKSNILQSANAVNVITILVITAICVALILLLSKSIFSSNSKDVPAGIDTGTISHTTTTAATSAPAESAAVTASSTLAETEPAVPAGPEYAYIITYVQLLAEPQAESAHLICMSPNIKVEVLERRADGFCQVSFLNGDGTTYTGYVLEDYLSSAEINRENPLEALDEEAPVEGQEEEQPAEAEQ